MNFLREQTLFKYFKSTHVKGDITNFNCKSFLEFIKTSSLSSLLASHWLVYSAAAAAAAAAKSLQSCPTLCDPTDGSSPGSPV